MKNHTSHLAQRTSLSGRVPLYSPPEWIPITVATRQVSSLLNVTCTCQCYQCPALSLPLEHCHHQHCSPNSAYTVLMMVTIQHRPNPNIDFGPVTLGLVSRTSSCWHSTPHHPSQTSRSWYEVPGLEQGWWRNCKYYWKWKYFLLTSTMIDHSPSIVSETYSNGHHEECHQERPNDRWYLGVVVVSHSADSEQQESSSHHLNTEHSQTRQIIINLNVSPDMSHKHLHWLLISSPDQWCSI